MPDKYWKPTVSSAGQVSWTLTDSTTAPSSQNIKGPSPVKGTDYYTQADKNSIVSDLVSEIQSSKLETKSITQNGTYTPSSGKIGFSSVNVNVSSGTTVQTYNGTLTYNASSSALVYKTMTGLTFTPDAIFFQGETASSWGVTYYGAIPIFMHTGTTEPSAMIENHRTNPSTSQDFFRYNPSNGQLGFGLLTSSGSLAAKNNVTISYTAVKWT